jgi:hypothetical protein
MTENSLHGSCYSFSTSHTTQKFNDMKFEGPFSQSWSCLRTIPEPSQANYRLHQPFSIFLPWRNPWNNSQVSGNQCIKNIISTAHGTLAWSVSCRYNNPVIIVNALLSREWYFFSGSVYFGQQVQKTMFFFCQSRSIAEPLATSRGTPVEKPWSTQTT